MPQPAPRPDGPQIFHVNFHTQHSRAVFEVPAYLDLLTRLLPQVLEKWGIPCLAWQIMPTHVHLVLVTFADQSLGRVMRLIKGGTAHDLLAAAPELRADLGDHLWQEGYDWVEVTSQRQCATAIRYVRENRQRSGLD
ncbi:MAG TPA: transposase [Ktedonobacterales bacterium]|jgi:REP element-mobilizing transposase RayT